MKPGVVIYESDPSAAGPALRLAAENRRALETAVDASGRRLQIISMDDAYEVQTRHSLFCRSYSEFLHRQRRNRHASLRRSRRRPGPGAVIQAAFPDREVVQIDITQLASGRRRNPLHHATAARMSAARYYSTAVRMSTAPYYSTTARVSTASPVGG